MQTLDKLCVSNKKDKVLNPLFAMNLKEIALNIRFKADL